MIEFKMPSLGSDMDEGTLNEWLVKPGDKVTRGQVVAIVETTKAAVEVECWQEGIVDELVVPVGETVQVGTTLATLTAPGEPAEKQPKPRPAPKAAAKPATAPPTAPPPSRAPTAAPGHRRWVSPAARRLATSLSVDIEAVTGTGPQGAVTINDVEHAAAAKPAAPKPVAQPGTKPTAADRATQMRKSIAAAMSRSKREIPHYYLAEEIRLEKSLSWLTTRNAQRSIDERVLPAVLLLKAVGVAAQRDPDPDVDAVGGLEPVFPPEPVELTEPLRGDADGLQQQDGRQHPFVDGSLRV
ncbi:biotin/lipoyl-containing protein, partial [Mycobacterium scrofulaceum]|uniref:biotin/lipoyl-containing protein n=1 Tax=Mycobacterium scrofulaceum TaxID=1783 RepID=UPI0018D4B3AD